jgi:hypothetical protein
MKNAERFAEEHASVQVLPCPRCRHLSRFQQAASDHAWVCQRCLRVRVPDPAQRGQNAYHAQPVTKRD